VRHPLSTADFSSYLLQAQASGAKVIGLANAGGDTINSIKQASQFGIVQAGQKLAALLLFISDVHALGLPTAQGLTLTTGFYWDQSDEARAWSEKFKEQHGVMPTMVHAGVYSAVRHYLQAVKDAGSDETDTVVEKMRATPIQDAVIPEGKILANGSIVHDVFLAEVKKPEESKGEWDYYKILRTIPGDQAFLAVEDSGCELGG
jgi:branched-chain amino acid transport system substrate-binding protein